MTKIISVGDINPKDLKQNPLKAFSEWFSSLDKFTKLLIITTIILVITTPIIVRTILTLTQHANEDVSLESLTNNLVARSATTGNTLFSIGTTSTETSLAEKAIQRKGLMLAAAKADPENFLLNALDSKATALLVSNVQQYTEKEVDLEGFLLSDDSKENLTDAGNTNAQSEAVSLIFQNYDSDGGVVYSYRVYLTKDQEPELNKKIKIKGYLLDNVLVPISFTYLDSSTGTRQISVASPQQLLTQGNTTSNGVKKLAAVIVNVDGFTEDISNRGKFTKEDVAAFYFTDPKSVSSYISKASFQKLQIQGDITDVYDNVTLTGYSRQDLCDISEENHGRGFTKKINNIVKQRASAIGKDFSQYTFVGYILPYIPDSVCGWNAISRGIPGIITNVKPYHFLNGDYLGYKKSYPNYYKNFYAGILSHELAHNIGLAHAHGLNCGAQRIDPYSNCIAQGYADRFDIIGGSWDYFPGISANNKLRLGYIASQNVQTVNQNGTYKLYSSSVPRTGQTQLLKIKRKDNSYYYVEYRTKQRADTGLPASIFNGAFVRLSNIPSYSMKDEKGNWQWIKEQTYLIDMTRGDRDRGARHGFDINPTLTDNLTYQDLANGISIKQISHDLVNGTADLKITLGSAPCVSANPSISFVPTSQSAYAGEKLTYQITVKNNNSNCSASTYNINSQVPSGWQVVISKNPVTISSREKFVLTAEVTSASTALPVSQRIKFEVKDNANPTFSVTKALAYVVLEPIITVTPTNTPTPTPTLTPTPTPTPTPTNTPTPTPVSSLSIMQLISVADSWVKKDNSTDNHGTDTAMWADADPVAISYLKFDLSRLRGKTIVKATLNLTVSGGTNAGSALRRGVVVKSSIGTWKEDTINFNNKPDFGAPITSFTGDRDTNEIIGLDITSYIQEHPGELVSLILQNKGPDGVRVKTREASNGKPILIIEYH